MKKISTYNSDAKQFELHFKQQVMPRIMNLLNDFIAEHPNTKENDSFDELGNVFMRTGLQIKSLIKTNPINK